MAKKPVVECECDRCGRVWYVPAVPASEQGGPVPDGKLDLTFQPPAGEPLKAAFGVLCESCTQTVENYVRSILRKPKAKEGEKEEGSEDPSHPTTEVPAAQPGVPAGPPPRRS